MNISLRSLSFYLFGFYFIPRCGVIDSHNNSVQWPEELQHCFTQCCTNLLINSAQMIPVLFSAFLGGDHHDH